MPEQSLPSLLAAVLIGCLILVTPVIAQDQQKPQKQSGATLQPAADRTPHWYQLPLSVRRDLPPTTISVHYWNEDVARRFIKVGDARIAEGDLIGDELWLREIRRDSVVLEFKGHRFVIDR